MSDSHKLVTLSTLKAMRERGEKIAVLTGYDASFARLMDAAGVDIILVGDSWAWWCRAMPPPCRSGCRKCVTTPAAWRAA